jgi:type II secretory pathway pseudopilin PulG
MKKQQGFSLTGMIVTAILVALLAALAVKVVPSVLEYQAVAKVVGLTAQEANAEHITDVTRIRNIFGRKIQVESVYGINENLLTIQRAGSGVSIRLEYEKRIPLFLNASLLLEFKTESTGE